MAALLNVLPLAGVPNASLQKLLQDLRNLQVGRQGLRMSMAQVIAAVEGPGGSVADLAALYGITSAQAQVLYDETASFFGKLNSNGSVTVLQDAWDQANRVMGISV